MLSFKPSVSPKKYVAFAVLGASLMLGACGFKPIYATNSDTGGTTAFLRTVHIDLIDERIGQMLRTALKRRFHPTRTNAAYQYALHVEVSESISELAVEKDASTTRANLKLSANFQLVRIADQFQLHAGTVRGVSSYNNLTSNFATEAAKKNARKHAIESMADQLKTRISVYFTGPGLKQPPLGYVQEIQ